MSRHQLIALLLLDLNATVIQRLGLRRLASVLRFDRNLVFSLKRTDCKRAEEVFGLVLGYLEQDLFAIEREMHSAAIWLALPWRQTCFEFSFPLGIYSPKGPRTRVAQASS